MVDDIPYIPDVFRELATRVNTELAKLDTPIEVLFNNGLYSQVSSDLYKDGEPIDKALIWLAMPYAESRKSYQLGRYCEFSGEIIIAKGTKADYTQSERETLIFEPILIPIYKELIRQISLTEIFGYPHEDKIEHIRKDLPYWGGGEAHLTNTDNLFKNQVDAIRISDLSLDIGFQKNCTFTSNF